MPEEHSHTGSWLRRITGSLSGEPRDLEDLNEVLVQARERGIIDSDAHAVRELGLVRWGVATARRAWRASSRPSG